MAYKIVNDDSLTSVANAIRTKGSISGTLVFPSGFVSAIQNLPSGGSNDFIITASKDGQGNLTIDKTFSEVATAYNAGKNIAVKGDEDNYHAGMFDFDIHNNCFYIYGIQFGGDDLNPTMAGDTYVFYSNLSYLNNTKMYYEPHDTTATPSDVASGKTFINWSGHQTGTATPPSGTYSITSNGIYNIVSFASVDVNVSGGGGSDHDVEDAIVARTISGVYENSRMTSVGAYAFCSCTSLTTASFPNATSIGTNAFYGCTSLTTASFPSATSIGGYAFQNCTSLTTASFPKVTSIGGYAFYGCTKLTTASFPSATSIGTNAFYGCTSLTTASFPSATSIGGYAFQNCTSLTTANFPSATLIGYATFSLCKNLTITSFPNVTSIGDYAFASCTSLTTASFPNATSIGSCAFYRCSSLMTANFPSVASIGNSAFYGCPSLTAANFPNVTSILTSVFAYCSGLTTASFPNATLIGSYALRGCSSLTTISFPNATLIGDGCFRSCVRLESLYVLASSVATLGTSVFLSTPMSLSSYLGYFGSIYVPASLVDSYKTATRWSEYSARITSYME